MSFLTKVKGSRNWYYKRRIPEDVIHHYPSIKGGQIVRSTKTSNKQQAVTVASRITRQLEDEWDSRRGLVPDVSSSVLKGARLVLERVGLPATKTPQSLTHEREAWVDMLEAEMPYEVKEALHYAHVNHDVQAVDELLELYLPADVKAALMISNGQFRMTASVMKDEYLRQKGKQDERKELDSLNPAFEALYEHLGDRHPSEYRTYDVQTLVAHMQAKGWKTGTVKKRMGCLRKVFNYVSKVYDDREAAQHPFRSYDEFISGLGDDVVEKEDFTPEQLARLRESVDGQTDELSGLIAIMLDTGMRPSEACSLSLDDVHQLTREYPFLSLQKNTFRRLKTKSSVRFVPLVGVGKKYVNSVQGKWLFPSYIDEEKRVLKNENASIAVNARLRAILGGDSPTSHSFRHTMTTRLRDVGCNRDVREELLGWTKSTGDNYGSPTDIKFKTEYIVRSFEWEGQGWRQPKN